MYAPTNSIVGKLIGQNTLYCKADAKWTSPVFECVVVNLTSDGGINHQPTNIQLSSYSMPENMSPGTVIGWLRTVDPDRNQNHIYTLNNLSAVFAINRSQLYLKGNKVVWCISNYTHDC